MRVVSLVPSITETLLAWGVDVVACTRFCEQPQLRTRRRDQGPRHRRDRRPGPGPRRHGPGGEPAARRRRARRGGAGVARHPRHRAGRRGADARRAGRRRRCRRRAGRAAARCAGAGHRGRADLAPPVDGPRPRHLRLDGARPPRRRPTCCPAPSATRRCPSTTWPVPISCCCRPSRTRSRTATSPRWPRASRRRDVRIVDGADLLWWGVRTPGALARLAAALR